MWLIARLRTSSPLAHLIIGLTAVALVTMVIAWRHLQERLVERVGTSLALAAHDIAGKLDLLLAERYGDLQMMSRAPVLRDGDATAVTNYLQSLRSAYPVYAWIGMANARGAVVAATDQDDVGTDWSGEPWFRELQGTGKIAVRDASPSAELGGHLAVSFAAPIYAGQNEFRGVVVAHIGLSAFENLFTGTTTALQAQHGTGVKVEYQFLRRNGELIADSLRSDEGQTNLQHLGVPSALLFQGAVSGYTVEKHGRRRTMVMTGYAQTKGAAPLDQLSWGVLVRLDWGDVIAPIHAFLWKLGAAGVLVCAPFVGLLLWLAGQLKQEWAKTKQTEQALQASQDRLRAIIDAEPACIKVVDPEGTLLQINAAGLSMIQADDEGAVTGRPVFPLVAREHQEAFRSFHVRVCQGAAASLEFEIVGLKGARRWVESHAVPIRLAPHMPVMHLAVTRDITAEKQAEGRLALQHEVTHVIANGDSEHEAIPLLLRTICHGLGWELGAYWEVDGPSDLLRCRHVWHRGDSVEVAEFAARTRTSTFSNGVGLPGRVWASGKAVWIRDVVADDNFPRAPYAEQAGIHGGLAFPITSGDRVQGVMEFFAQAVREPDHVLLQVLETLAGQISLFISRKRAKEELRLVVESVPNGILMLNQDGTIALVNAQVEQVFGYARQELLGRPVEVLIPERYRAHHAEHRRAFCATPCAREMSERRDLVGLRKDGTEFPVEIGLTPIETVNGLRTLAVVADTAERKRTEHALHAAKEKAEQTAKEKAGVLAALRVFFICLDGRGLVKEWTPSAELLLGLSLCDVLGHPFRSLPIGWDWQEVEPAIDRVRQSLKEVQIDKLVLKQPNGQDLFVKLQISALCDDQETGVVIMGEDVTERLQLERDLVQAQKLESIGQLAAGIAHEINTPIQFIGDNVRFLHDSFADCLAAIRRYRELLAVAKQGAPAPDVIGSIEAADEAADLSYVIEEIPKALSQSAEGVERIAKIVRAMKEFAHPGIDEKAPANINKAIESTVTVARNEWKYVADLKTDLDPSLPAVPCLVGEFNQVVLNMIVNATHAIADVVKGSGEKGNITISTGLDGEFAEIRIADSGTGIPETIRPKIFDPFFTTKEVGKGTGQGLAIARSVVVDKHGGTITVDSEVGKGTTFIIRLPLHTTASGKAATEGMQ